jgi:hypothetical protein
VNEDESQALRDQFRLQSGTDAFGVPNGLMGIHDEEFFQILGRIVALSALVEMRLVTLYEILTPLPARRKRVRGTGDLFEHCKQELSRFPHVDAEFIQAFLDAAAQCLRTRHGYAHSLWPAQGGDEQFAWRPDVRKNLSATIEFTKTPVQMRDDLNAVVRLLDAGLWNRAIRVAQGHELQPEGLTQ